MDIRGRMTEKTYKSYKGMNLLPKKPAYTVTLNLVQGFGKLF